MQAAAADCVSVPLFARGISQKPEMRDSPLPRTHSGERAASRTHKRNRRRTFARSHRRRPQATGKIAPAPRVMGMIVHTHTWWAQQGGCKLFPFRF